MNDFGFNLPHDEQERIISSIELNATTQSVIIHFELTYAIKFYKKNQKENKRCNCK